MGGRISRGWAYLAYLIAAAGMIGASMIASGAHPYGMIAAYYGLCVALPCALIIRKSRCIHTLRPDSPRILSLLPVIFLTFLALGIVNAVTLLWEIPFELIGWDMQAAVMIEPSNARELVLSVIINAAVPAICEEMLFRGVILTALEPYGTKRAAVISSALFMLLHGSLIGAPAEFLLGVLLCVIVITTKSIWSGIIFHTIYNAMVIAVNYLYRGEAEAQTVLESIGGKSGILSLLIDMALFALPAYYFIRALIYRAKAERTVVFPARRVPMGKGAWAALIAALVIAAVLYAADIALMAGVSA